MQPHDNHSARAYENSVIPFSHNLKRALPTQEEINDMQSLASQVSTAKSSETHHQRDNHQELKRSATGFLGELAMEKPLSIPIIDRKIGESSKYHHPDIPGYRVGNKTVEYGKFPVIFKKNNYYPQIICIRGNSQGRDDVIWVCGLATTNVLNTYQDDDLIVSPTPRQRGTKTGFYGSNALTKVEPLTDLEPYKLH